MDQRDAWTQNRTGLRQPLCSAGLPGLMARKQQICFGLASTPVPPLCVVYWVMIFFLALLTAPCRLLISTEKKWVCLLSIVCWNVELVYHFISVCFKMLCTESNTRCTAVFAAASFIAAGLFVNSCQMLFFCLYEPAEHARVLFRYKIRSW